MLDRGCPTHILQRIQVVSRHVIRGLRLHQSGGRRVVVSSGNCALREQLLPRGNNLLLQLKLRLCLRHIQLGLMVVFRHLRLRLHVKGSLRRRVLTLVIERLGAEVAVLKLRQKLARLHLRTSLYIESTNRSCDLWRNRGLCHRRERRIRHDVFRYLPHLWMLRLDRHDRSRVVVCFLASLQKPETENHHCQAKACPAKACQSHAGAATYLSNRVQVCPHNVPVKICKAANAA